MSGFASLPTELQDYCVQYLDNDTLKSFRLASRASATLGAEHLFRAIVLRFNDASAKKLTHILEDTRLQAIVKQVIFDSTLDKPLVDFHDLIHYHSLLETTPWNEAINKLAQFPNLKDAQLWFEAECMAPDDDDDEIDVNIQLPVFRRSHQLRFFKALETARKVKSLTIKNMQDMLIEDIGPQDIIAAVRDRLDRFAVQIATEDLSSSPEDKVHTEEFMDCLQTRLKIRWLVPLQNQLTHLTVYCDSEWGVIPFTDFRGVHFPGLVSLAFGNWMVAHDWQIDWVIKHGATLEELFLDNVSIAYFMWIERQFVQQNWPDIVPWKNRRCTTVQYQTRWSDVFPKFQHGLPKLRHYGMEHGGWSQLNTFDVRYTLPATIRFGRYTAFNGGCWDMGFSEEVYEDESGVEITIVHPGEEQWEKDENSLQEFLKSIGQRKTIFRAPLRK